MSLTALLFLATYGAGLVMAFARHPVYGLLTYMLAFYGFPPGRWWGFDLPDLRWSLVAAIVTLLASAKIFPPEGQQPWYRTVPAVFLIIFTLWVWLQTPWAASPLHTGFAVLMSKYIVLFALMYRIIDNEKTMRTFLLAHVAGCAYFGLIAFQSKTGGRFENIGGPGVNDANAFATHMTTGVIIAGVMLLQTRGAVRIGVLLAIPFILNGVVLAGSRGAFLGLVAGGAAVMYLKPKAYRRIFYLLALLAVVLVLRLGHDLFWDRIASITDSEEERDNSAASRVVILYAQWRMFKLSPVLGHGHRGTAMLSPLFLDDRWLTGKPGERARSSHNTFMSVLVEQGVFGAMLFLALLAWTAIRFLRLKSLDSRGLPTSLGLYRAAFGGALVSIFVAGQFADYLKMEAQVWMLVLMVVLERISARALDEGTTGRDEKQAPRPPRPSILNPHPLGESAPDTPPLATSSKRPDTGRGDLLRPTPAGGAGPGPSQGHSTRDPVGPGANRYHDAPGAQKGEPA